MDDQREGMIVGNLPLVSFVVNKMMDESGSSPLDREDAIAYGIEGLIQAADNFDPSRGTTFASFAIRRIRGSILDAIRRLDHLPRSLRRSTRELEKATLELAAALGRWPNEQELAAHLGSSPTSVRAVANHGSMRIVSLERVMEERSAEGSNPWECKDPDEFGDPALATERKAAMLLLDSALDSLPPRDRLVLRLRYGRGMAFHEIGRIMDLSESRVCQIHKRILSTLRIRLENDLDRAA
jgi:RNA polymerase sigma factor for flagellar operon FliA